MTAKWKQECIPVGCVPPAAVAVWWGVCLSACWETSPPRCWPGDPPPMWASRSPWWAALCKVHVSLRLGLLSGRFVSKELFVVLSNFEAEILPFEFGSFRSRKHAYACFCFLTDQNYFWCYNQLQSDFIVLLLVLLSRLFLWSTVKIWSLSEIGSSEYV